MCSYVRWCLLGLAAILLPTPRVARADWESYQHDTGHTGFTTASPTPSALHLEWSAPTGFATPVTVGNTIIATQNGQGTGNTTTVGSFQLDTGAENWF